MDDERFLRSDVIIEPLADGFYAWLHTIAPVQAAMNLAFLQVPLLESYLQSPEVHVASSHDPELRGGYFVDIEEARSGQVQQSAHAQADDAGRVIVVAAVERGWPA